MTKRIVFPTHNSFFFNLRLPSIHDAAPAGDAPGDPNGSTADASDMPPCSASSSEVSGSSSGEAACGVDVDEDDDAAIEQQPAVFFFEGGHFGRPCLFRPRVRV